MQSSCPMCGFNVQGTFPAQCPNCPFSLTILATGGTTPWQQQKWNEHTDLLVGRQVQLYGKQYNASFDYAGAAKLEEVLRFTVTYGDRAALPSARGNYLNPVVLSYIPEPIGSGTSICQPSLVPCSGVCIISPQSTQWAHPFPVMDDWVRTTFPNQSSHCRLCGTQTGFAQPICSACYQQSQGNWISLL